MSTKEEKKEGDNIEKKKKKTINVAVIATQIILLNKHICK